MSQQLRTAFRSFVPCLVLLVLLVPVTALAGPYTFETIDYPGEDYTYLSAINASGQIVGQNGNGAGQTFLFSGGVFSSIVVPGPWITVAQGINNNGEIVGATDNPSLGLLGFDLKGGIVTRISFPFAISTYPFAINDVGAVVGAYTDAGQAEHGFLLSNNAFTTIEPRGAIWTAPYGLNNAGQIGGAYRAGLYVHGFLLSGGAYSYFDCPGPSYESTYIFGINNSQDVAGTCGANYMHGFLLSNGILSTIDFPGSNQTWVTALNDNGQMVGFYSVAGESKVHGFLATPVPEPSGFSAILAGLGFGLILIARSNLANSIIARVRLTFSR